MYEYPDPSPLPNVTYNKLSLEQQMEMSPNSSYGIATQSTAQPMEMTNNTSYGVVTKSRAQPMEMTNNTSYGVVTDSTQISFQENVAYGTRL